MFQVTPDRFDGIQVVLVERLHPGPGNTERIQHSNLNQVVTARTARYESPSLTDMSVDLPVVENRSGKVRKALPGHCGHLRVEFHGIDMRRTLAQGQQHIRPGASAENQHLRLIEQLVGQGCRCIGQKAKRAQIASVSRDHTHAIAIGKHSELVRGHKAGV